MRSDLQEAALLLAGVLIWCRSSEGEHSEVWLKTGFWFDFVGFCLFLVFFFIICFSPLVPLGQLVSVVIIFGFLSSWFVSSFFGWLDFWSFLPVTPAPRTCCTPTTGLLALIPGWRPRWRVRGVGGEA